MSSIYDFENLEREAKDLKKEFEKYLSREASLNSELSKLEFDDSKYGEKAIDDRLKSIFKDGERKIGTIFNLTYDEIKSSYESSFSKLKSKAKEAEKVCTFYNLILQSLSKLNNDYRNKNYRKIIDSSETLFTSDNSVYSYFLLLKANSYKFETNSLMENLDDNNTGLFLDYVEFCRKNDAKNHLGYASYICFEHLYLLVNKIELEDSKKYIYLKESLVLKDTIPSEHINNSKIDDVYKAFCKLYNAFASKYFNDFSYNNFVSLMNDSFLLKNVDIDNEILKRQSNSLESKLDFFLLKGNNKDNQNLMDAVVDLRAVIKDDLLKNKYINKVLSLVYENNINVLETLLNFINEDLGYISFLKIFGDLLVKEAKETYYYNVLLNHLVKTVTLHKDKLPLLYTVKDLIDINDKINVKELEMNRTFYCVCLSLIKSTRKYLASLDDITKNKLNKLYHDAYLIIFNKSPKKYILYVKKAINFDDKFLIGIKITSGALRLSKKKLFITLGVALLIIAICIVILCVIFI